MYSYYIYFHHIQLPSLLISIGSTLSKNLCVLPAATIIFQMLNRQPSSNDKGMVHTISNWYIFKPLSKVNYGVYIVHVAVILHLLLKTDGTSLVNYGSMPEVLTNIYPFAMLLTTVVAAILFVVFELPIISTFKLLYYRHGRIMNVRKKEK